MIDMSSVIAEKYKSNPQVLQAAVLGQQVPGLNIDPYTALSALQKIKEANSMQNAQMAQQPTQQPSMLQDAMQQPRPPRQEAPAPTQSQGIMSMPMGSAMRETKSKGIAGLPTPDQEMARGGIVAFAEGGDSDSDKDRYPTHEEAVAAFNAAYPTQQYAAPTQRGPISQAAHDLMVQFHLLPDGTPGTISPQSQRAAVYGGEQLRRAKGGIARFKDAGAIRTTEDPTGTDDVYDEDESDDANAYVDSLVNKSAYNIAPGQSNYSAGIMAGKPAPAQIGDTGSSGIAAIQANINAQKANQFQPNTDTVEDILGRLEKRAGPSPYADMQAQIDKATEGNQQQFEQAKGYAALAAIPAILQGNNAIRGLGQGFGAWGSEMAKAADAKSKQDQELMKMNINLADAQRKEKLGLTKDAYLLKAEADKNAIAAFDARNKQYDSMNKANYMLGKLQAPPKAAAPGSLGVAGMNALTQKYMAQGMNETDAKARAFDDAARATNAKITYSTSEFGPTHAGIEQGKVDIARGAEAAKENKPDPKAYFAAKLSAQTDDAWKDLSPAEQQAHLTELRKKFNLPALTPAGTPAPAAAKPMSTPIALPASRDAKDFVINQVYNTARGPATWNGKQFISVQPAQ